MAVHLPVCIRGVLGRLQVFIVEGDTPLLVGRPILKALQVKTDLCSVLGGELTTALLGPNGEFLLQLDEGLDEDTMQQALSFDLVTDELVEDTASPQDPAVSLLSLSDYLADTGREGPPAVRAPITPRLLKSLEVSARQYANAVSQALEEALWSSSCTLWFSGRCIQALGTFPTRWPIGVLP